MRDSWTYQSIVDIEYYTNYAGIIHTAVRQTGVVSILKCIDLQLTLIMNIAQTKNWPKISKK